MKKTKNWMACAVFACRCQENWSKNVYGFLVLLEIEEAKNSTFWG